jgi:hypothetical protein
MATGRLRPTTVGLSRSWAGVPARRIEHGQGRAANRACWSDTLPCSGCRSRGQVASAGTRRISTAVSSTRNLPAGSGHRRCRPHRMALAARTLPPLFQQSLDATVPTVGWGDVVSSYGRKRGPPPRGRSRHSGRRPPARATAARGGRCGGRRWRSGGRERHRRSATKSTSCSQGGHYSPGQDEPLGPASPTCRPTSCSSCCPRSTCCSGCSRAGTWSDQRASSCPFGNEHVPERPLTADRKNGRLVPDGCERTIRPRRW